MYIKINSKILLHLARTGLKIWYGMHRGRIPKHEKTWGHMGSADVCTYTPSSRTLPNTDLFGSELLIVGNPSAFYKEWLDTWPWHFLAVCGSFLKLFLPQQSASKLECVHVWQEHELTIERVQVKAVLYFPSSGSSPQFVRMFCCLTHYVSLNPKRASESQQKRSVSRFQTWDALKISVDLSGPGLLTPVCSVVG